MLTVLFVLLLLIHQNISEYIYLNNKPTYFNLSDDFIKAKPSDILVFIGITSGPVHSHLRNAIRQTWLLPCKISDYCDYKFFIDIVEKHMTDGVLDEYSKYKDMVFRDSCPLMTRHHPKVNYGNSAPVRENLPASYASKYNENKVSDYIHRRFYKIDWKVCFMLYCSYHNITADYHVYVEDDSYVSTENLLYQLSIVKEKQKLLSNNFSRINGGGLGFRTGTPLYDGFDDSSTIISNDVVQMFVSYYQSDKLNCTNVYNHLIDSNQSILNSANDIYVWLSWGNSWRESNCNWRHELNLLNFSMNLPVLVCLSAVYKLNENNTNYHNLFMMIKDNNSINKLKSYINDSILLNEIEIFDYCNDRSLILHHHSAGTILLSDSKRLFNFPKHAILIDKLKDPKYMYELWDINKSFIENYVNISSFNINRTLYVDYSDVFLYDDYYGWEKFISSYNNNLKEFCYKHRDYNECKLLIHRRQLTELQKLGLRDTESDD